MNGRFLICSLFFLGITGFVLPTVSAAEDQSFERIIQPFLKQHCFDCHGAEEQQFQLRFDALRSVEAADRHLWTLLHEQIASGAMPPEGQPRPSDKDKQQVLAAIEKAQLALGRAATRRLNRRELAAALQDVSGLTVDLSYALPDDGKVDGFDTGADGLQDAADSVAQALAVTRRAVDGIRFRSESRAKLYAADVRDAKDVKKVFDAWKADGVTVNSGDVVSQPGTGWFIKPKWLPDRGGLTIRIPPPTQRGILRLKFVVSLQKPSPKIPDSQLWVEVGGRDVAYVEIDSSADAPQTLEYQIHLADVTADAKGLAITLTNRVEMPYEIDGYPNEDRSKPEEKIPNGGGLFRPAFDAKTLPITQQPVPLVVLHNFAIEADFQQQWPPADWKFGAGDLSDDRASAERLLVIWIERAWRRPVSVAEQQRFLGLYDQERKRGQDFDEALRAAFHAALMSGSFRYLSVPGPDNPHDQFAIASRLSFFLWGAPPDAELRGLASKNKLRDPAVLDAQVLRLLTDSRSELFFHPFVMQWLEMGQPITLAMDHIQKQDFRFGRNLKASLQQETIAYVTELLQQNRPARELIASNWSMHNDILARHYGYEKIHGGRLRRVTLKKDDPRGGGILSHAGIQSMLCWMGENWVIYRGAWTLRRILDDPPPPPPLEVPELIPSDGKNVGKSFKQLLVQHQEDARCAVCHKSMDPLGFAFQNFDLSGRWRESEFEKYVRNELDGKIEWRGSGKERPVDATGKLPRGETFTSFVECKQLLFQYYTDDIVRGWLKNVFLYSTGRKPEIADLAEIRQIMATHRPRGYPLRELLQSVVRSRAFLGERILTKE
ncbi:hypothetical protein ETAA8_46160 [Anatilimnocola aggregata]|uniref:DUF1592 domain-containing protein n=1 Tax=Anatilimnocola aggregata TaxID=2528021 RepID=A0A517YGY8_9BACT|nr:DUF1592 domain-containing protein [Anatilimnocola aggregata]QDU29504.1 hypothetical protein ETAA8_46160 [Anatilimnocola aggregata]